MVACQNKGLFNPVTRPSCLVSATLFVTENPTNIRGWQREKKWTIIVSSIERNWRRRNQEKDWETREQEIFHSCC